MLSFILKFNSSNTWWAFIWLSIIIILSFISTILNIFAKYHTNILTIHQSIPINGIGILTLSVDILSITTDVSAMLDEVEHLERIISVKIIARE